MTLEEAMRKEGFNPPKHIRLSGFTRFPTKESGFDNDGWVSYFSNGTGATFGCFRAGTKFVWREDDNTVLTETERSEIVKSLEEAIEEARLEKIADYHLAACTAEADFERAKAADELHPYLIKKGIKPNMARFDECTGRLLIPVYCYPEETQCERLQKKLSNCYGDLDPSQPLRLQSIQYIEHDGEKRFLKNGRMKGGHVWIGKPENGSPLLLCEGFATGDTLYRATGNAVCVCFSAGNIKIMAEQVRKYFPAAQLVICGDDDVKNPKNPGRTKATEAARAIQGKVALPVFASEDSGTDFNDLEQAEGLDVVLRQIAETIALRIQIPALKAVFTAPKLEGVDARDGTNNTRPLSELGNAYRLLDAHGDNIYYVNDAKAWLHWKDGAWIWCIDGSTVRMLAAYLPEQIYREGNYHLADAEHFAGWSRTSQKERTIEASLSLLQNFAQVRLPLALVDSDIFKVGFDNAKQVIDLGTGQVRPAQKDDLITKSLRVSCLGDSAQSVKWQAFLAQIFSNDVKLIDWMQRWCGYLLTGSTAEQFFLFCFGFGANGKSVLAETIRYILGDYARAIATETLTESKRQAGGASPDIAELIGTRLAISTETEDGTALAESLIKSLVAGDTMTARKLYSAPIQFTPQFKLMMLGNHKPVIRGNDFGIWRRVRLLPFRRTFKEQDRDPELLNKLKGEAPHILAWMVEGCLEWQRRGLADIPETIRQATNQYKDDQDLIGKWIEASCVLAPGYETTSTELYASYKNWCLDNGLRPVSNIRLGRGLSERGFNSRQSNSKSLWAGIAVMAIGSISTNDGTNKWDSWGIDD